MCGSSPGGSGEKSSRTRSPRSQSVCPESADVTKVTSFLFHFLFFIFFFYLCVRPFRIRIND